jgi:DNA-binding transcriptional regulator of glucitol operon
MEGKYAFIILVLAAGWFLQVWLVGQQTRNIYNRMKVLRKDGRTSIGLAGNIYKGRVYTVLVVDEEDRILHAERLAGVTVFAKLKPVPELVGVPLEELMDEGKDFGLPKKTLQAFRHAGKEFNKANESDAEESSMSQLLGHSEKDDPEINSE